VTEASARNAAVGRLPGGPADLPVWVAHSAEEVRRCGALLRELRPHLGSADAVVTAWEVQVREGYRLAYLQPDGEPVAAIGYRRMTTLAWGRVLYIDDLVVDPRQRGRGLGTILMGHAFSAAKAEGCDEVHLDSGFARHAAHRLYLHHGMELRCHHFARAVGEE
jgi:GNAT superfamily N-acetyltransferase